MERIDLTQSGDYPLRCLVLESLKKARESLSCLDWKLNQVFFIHQILNITKAKCALLKEEKFSLGSIVTKGSYAEYYNQNKRKIEVPLISS